MPSRLPWEKAAVAWLLMQSRLPWGKAAVKWLFMQSRLPCRTDAGTYFDTRAFRKGYLISSIRRVCTQSLAASR